jgi:hypothetical protein
VGEEADDAARAAIAGKPSPSRRDGGRGSHRGAVALSGRETLDFANGTERAERGTRQSQARHSESQAPLKKTQPWHSESQAPPAET